MERQAESKWRQQLVQWRQLLVQWRGRQSMVLESKWRGRHSMVLESNGEAGKAWCLSRNLTQTDKEATDLAERGLRAEQKGWLESRPRGRLERAGREGSQRRPRGRPRGSREVGWRAGLDGSQRRPRGRPRGSREVGWRAGREAAER